MGAGNCFSGSNVRRNKNKMNFPMKKEDFSRINNIDLDIVQKLISTVWWEVLQKPRSEGVIDSSLKEYPKLRGAE